MKIYILLSGESFVKVQIGTKESLRLPKNILWENLTIISKGLNLMPCLSKFLLGEICTNQPLKERNWLTLLNNLQGNSYMSVIIQSCTNRQVKELVKSLLISLKTLKGFCLGVLSIKSIQ